MNGNEAIFIMAEDPTPDISPQDIKGKYSPPLTENELAEAFAITSNKFWWIEDIVYDYDEGSPEYQQAKALVAEWQSLMEVYEAQIYGILKSEGVVIPEYGQIDVLIPFMERNGFEDCTGWWMKKHQKIDTQ